MASVSKPTLYYFDARGRGEIIRLIAAEVGLEYQEVSLGTYNFAGEQSQAFRDLVASGQLAYNQVPFWKEPSGFTLTQSAAIVRHLARKNKLYGKTVEEESTVDEILESIGDFLIGFSTGFRKVMTSQGDEQKKEAFEETKKGASKWFGFWERKLSANNKGEGYFVGDAITVADISIFNAVEFGQELANKDDYPLLSAHYGRIASRPGIAAYLKNEKRHPAFSLKV
eukprot:TRINITY_DN6370_c0_g1_i1.p1 TRINITY_DN6370_c0_g1~~TRINITY_DN6370_c0_g1_i1.p1  ORF type:complete len:226 (+),score=58.10 TRINITY_DN6370_c0_g1_i1:142-819(+)